MPLNQPVHTHQATLAQLGPTTWAAFHKTAADFKQAVGSSCGCGDLAVQAMQGFHDAVNLELGKPAQYPEALKALAVFTAQQAAKLGADSFLNEYADVIHGKLMALHTRFRSQLAGGHRQPLDTLEEFQAFLEDPRWSVMPANFSIQLRNMVEDVQRQLKAHGISSAVFLKELRTFFNRSMNQATHAARRVTYCPRHGCSPSYQDNEAACEACEDEKEGGSHGHSKKRKAKAAQAELSAGLLDYLLAGAAGAAGATIASAAITKALSSSAAPDALKVVDDRKKPEEEEQPAGTMKVLAPSVVEGDQAEVDVKDLMHELATILSNPQRLGEVNPETQKVLREGTGG